jgi:hypothetical protein
MAEEQPSLHIDTDWKKQAQDEKRKLAEQEQKKAAEAAASAGPSASAAAGRRPGAAGTRGSRELPPASFGALVNTLVTQALFYLGDLAPQGGEPAINLDMAKHQIDTLNILEEKTRGNLTEDEQKMLDTALYESRMRYVNVASQYV